MTTSGRTRTTPHEQMPTLATPRSTGSAAFMSGNSRIGLPPSALIRRFSETSHGTCRRTAEVQTVLRFSTGAATVSCTRSEEHTSELQSLMRISYAVFCLKKKINIVTTTPHTQTYIEQYVDTIQH